jgi:hypothetical protein
MPSKAGAVLAVAAVAAVAAGWRSAMMFSFDILDYGLMKQFES